MNGILTWLRTTFPQDDFADDWYGWLTNQISHLGLGVFLAMAVSAVWFAVDGEFPIKWHAWGLIVLGYGALEAVRPGGTIRDALEDIAFVCLYGAGGAFLVFTEVSPGQPHLVLSISDVLPVLGIAAAHIGGGVWRRV
jgi:hypothetical protein